MNNKYTSLWASIEDFKAQQGEAIIYELLFSNGKRYIGRTVRPLQQRLYEHSKIGGPVVDKVQNDPHVKYRILGYGGLDLERKMIKKYKTYDPEFGYNSDPTSLSLFRKSKELESQQVGK